MLNHIDSDAQQGGLTAHQQGSTCPSNTLFVLSTWLKQNFDLTEKILEKKS